MSEREDMFFARCFGFLLEKKSVCSSITRVKDSQIGIKLARWTLVVKMTDLKLPICPGASQLFGHV
jgi:hypothetical protein